MSCSGSPAAAAASVRRCIAVESCQPIIVTPNATIGRSDWRRRTNSVRCKSAATLLQEISSTSFCTAAFDIAICFGMSWLRIRVNSPILPILTLKLFALATSLERSKKDGQIGSLRPSTYHMVKTGQQRQAPSNLEYFDEKTPLQKVSRSVRHKLLLTTIRCLLYLLSTHAERQGVDISVTVCFFCVCVCTVTDFSAEDKASGIKFCTAVNQRPRQGIFHLCELCSPKSPKSEKSAKAPPPSRLWLPNTSRGV